MAEQGDQEHEIPPKIKLEKIEVGQWFTPFKDYQIPPGSERKEIHEITFETEIIGVGKLAGNTTRDTMEDEEPGLAVLPFGERPFEEKKKAEDEMETKLTELVVDFELGKGTKASPINNLFLPYQLEMRTPSGRIFKNRFTLENRNDEGIAYSYTWQEEGTLDEVRLWFPETEHSLEKIELRVTPFE